LFLLCGQPVVDVYVRLPLGSSLITRRLRLRRLVKCRTAWSRRNAVSGQSVRLPISFTNGFLMTIESNETYAFLDPRGLRRFILPMSQNLIQTYWDLSSRWMTLTFWNRCLRKSICLSTKTYYMYLMRLLRSIVSSSEVVAGPVQVPFPNDWDILESYLNYIYGIIK
jgi:hypothetical protein